jgi:hypothetical protein
MELLRFRQQSLSESRNIFEDRRSLSGTAPIGRFRMKAGRWRLRIARAVALILVVLSSSLNLFPYTVLTHEE